MQQKVEKFMGHFPAVAEALRSTRSNGRSAEGVAGLGNRIKPFVFDAAQGIQWHKMNTAVTVAYAGAACAGAVALIALWRDWRSISVWFFAVGMGILAAESAFVGLATDAVLPDEAAHWQHWRLMAMSLLPSVWMLFSLSYARGSYREFFRQWRYVLIGALVLPIALVCPNIFPRGLLFTAPAGMDWDRVEWVFQLQPAGFVLYAVLMVSAVVVLMNLERTIRAAIGTMRWRIKFMILGLAILFAVRAYTSSQLVLWQNLDPSLGAVDCAALVLACLLTLRSLFRDGSKLALFPSKAILENSLTALVAGVYLVAVGVLARLTASIKNAQAKTFFLLIVLVAVTVIALSDRARMYLRRFISRYFQRPLYDYRTVWRTLTEGIVSRVKQADLCQAAATLISEIFQVLSVTIWLMDEKRENLVFAASTSLSAAAGAGLEPQKQEARIIFQALQAHRHPIAFETIKDDWAVALRRLTPVQFESGGSRVCVPLVGGGQLLGVITLADRVGGMFFSVQDFDLLRCVGDQVAAGLLNAHLSQKLLQAKELEAFQTMSAFFVHDLKNTASTLNLMLQNLPVHFDNPDFRQDALRGMAKTCEHINHLISRLSLLRHDLQIKPVASDLSEVVSGVLTDWKGIATVTLVKNLRPCPATLLDREQISKVVANLVINASEAITRTGEIHIETSQSNGWAVLQVADNGCGMTPEFLSNALFRPFQTTKKKGLGIGMFQSKMIVEAHGGRIEVESEVPKGTTFRVLLPLEKQSK
jgi:putative PEP-CTERM system histidine kinase